MTGLDWIILGFVTVLAVYGYARGFIVGILSFAGFALGAFVGTRIGPALLPDGAESPYAPVFGLAGALLAGSILAGGLEGLGLRLRRFLRVPGLGVVDGLLGAALTAAVALGIAWILGAVALTTPGARELRGEVRASAILSRLNEALPPSGPILNALARFDPLPELPGGASREVQAPPPGIPRDPDVRRAGDSVVRVLGTACGLGVEGSGWAAGDGLVVTNAHVVAGQKDTIVQEGGEGERLEATAVAYVPRDDIAVLSVPGLTVAGLPLAGGPPAGTPAAILGFPENGPFVSDPGRIGAEQRVSSSDSYGRGPLLRRVVPFRGRVRSGNSGGPMVDARGRVVTTVFAATTGGERGGYGVPNTAVQDALARAREGTPSGTGPCSRQ